MTELDEIKELLKREMNNYIAKDTYTKGKIAGIRKALCIIEEVEKKKE